MSNKPDGRAVWILVIGDVAVLAIVTLFGFASHGELDSAGLRMLTTFLPLLTGWFAAAPVVGAYRLELAGQFSGLWRPAWAMILAAPLAAWLRSLWLGTAIVPVFVAVLGGVALAALLVWRLVFLFFWGRRTTVYG